MNEFFDPIFDPVEQAMGFPYSFFPESQQSPREEMIRSEARDFFSPSFRRDINLDIDQPRGLSTMESHTITRTFKSSTTGNDNYVEEIHVVSCPDGAVTKTVVTTQNNEEKKVVVRRLPTGEEEVVEHSSRPSNMSNSLPAPAPSQGVFSFLSRWFGR
uniref:Uncharacterized protein n=1 Tax=Schistocephalus solidus TaxID=70667 RepID=A0A0X3Q202_SCHSO